jgi:predicted amidophosphoribosyltransferase
LRLVKYLICVNVFIKCPTCGQRHCIDGVPPRRVDLALFRGSEHPMKCEKCQSDMDTMKAYCGERVGAEIVRREDPKY